MTKVIDGPFAFRGLHGTSSRCHLRVFRHPDRPVIAIATELANNPGTSITNALPTLAQQICTAFDIDSEVLLWVEHYTADDVAEESVEAVEFRPGWQPAWVPMTRERIEELTGKPLPGQ